MKRVILEIYDPFTACSLQVRLMDNIPLRHLPRPHGSQRRVGLDGVIRRIGHVRANDFQSLILAIGGESAMQREEFCEDGFEGGVGFHRWQGVNISRCWPIKSQEIFDSFSL